MSVSTGALASGVCAKCGAEFSWPCGGRGRPRKYCDGCRRVDVRRRTSGYVPVVHKTRKCSVCASEFEPTTALNVYCSRRCKDQGKPSASGLTCIVCGEGMVRGRTSRSDGDAMHNKCAPRHGRSGYRRGCRCGTCVSSVRIAMRDYAQLRRERGNPLLGGRWIDEESRKAIYDRDGGRCQICNVDIDFEANYMTWNAPTLDHIVPRSLGGDDSAENLRLACRRCNCSRSNRIDWEPDHVFARCD